MCTGNAPTSANQNEKNMPTRHAASKIIAVHGPHSICSAWSPPIESQKSLLCVLCFREYREDASYAFRNHMKGKTTLLWKPAAFLPLKAWWKLGEVKPGENRENLAKILRKFGGILEKTRWKLGEIPTWWSFQSPAKTWWSWLKKRLRCLNIYFFVKAIRLAVKLRAKYKAKTLWNFESWWKTCEMSKTWWKLGEIWKLGQKLWWIFQNLVNVSVKLRQFSPPQGYSETWWKPRENLVKTWWKLGENLVKTWWKLGEIPKAGEN